MPHLEGSALGAGLCAGFEGVLLETGAALEIGVETGLATGEASSLAGVVAEVFGVKTAGPGPLAG